jgi:PAS domain S-box-containing protein
MNPSDQKRSAELHLRAAAEKQIDNAPLTGGDPAHTDEKLLHELQVHQVELEMQNEALRQQQTELEAARDRYVDLYDFAPVGYLTLNSDGMIEELNLTAATLLDMERKDLLHRRFTALVVAEDQSRWMQLILSVMKSGGKSSVEVGLQRRDGTVFQAQLDCEATRVGAGDTAIRIALTDISLRKRTEAALRQQVDELERFNRAAIDRELAMIELKRQVNALSSELGRAPPFALDFADAPPTQGLT